MKRDEIRELSHRLDHLLEDLQERADPEVLGTVAELVDGLQRVHAEGLRRLAELLAQEPGLFERALEEPVISNLFLLYELAVVDPVERARTAVEPLRPMVRAHGGDLRVLSVREGIVRVRLAWSHDSVSRQADTLREGLEWALDERLPGYRGLEVEEVEGGEADEGGDAAGTASRTGTRPLPVLGSPGGGGGYESVVPQETVARLERRLRNARHGNGAAASRTPAARRVAVASEEEVSEAGLFGALVDGRDPVLLIRLAGEIRAFRNACPDSVLPLHLGELEDGILRCPWHGCRFEAATGARLGEEGPSLRRLPLEVEEGTVWVEIAP